MLNNIGTEAIVSTLLILVLENADVLSVLKVNNVIMMRADWTNKNDEIADYLAKYDRAGIPFNIIYGPLAPKGIILSELSSKQEIVKSIEKAKVK